MSALILSVRSLFLHAKQLHMQNTGLVLFFLRELIIVGLFAPSESVSGECLLNVSQDKNRWLKAALYSCFDCLSSGLHRAVFWAKCDYIF